MTLVLAVAGAGYTAVEGDPQTLITLLMGVDLALVASFLVLYQQGASRYGTALAGMIWRTWTAGAGFTACAAATGIALFAWGDPGRLPGSGSAWFAPALVGGSIIVSIGSVISMLRGVTHASAIRRYTRTVTSRTLRRSADHSATRQAGQRVANARAGVPSRLAGLRGEPERRFMPLRRIRAWTSLKFETMATRLSVAPAPATLIPQLARTAIAGGDTEALRIIGSVINGARPFTEEADPAVVEQIALEVIEAMATITSSASAVTAKAAANLIAAVSLLGSGSSAGEAEALRALYGRCRGR